MAVEDVFRESTASWEALLLELRERCLGDVAEAGDWRWCLAVLESDEQGLTQLPASTLLGP